ncbi:hypothetical protein OH77DRAFT_1188096 [Trametes cingulata]|nr:hypothetical protein OH77DRAFT_1188096 [Trametes cingulata]
MSSRPSTCRRAHQDDTPPVQFHTLLSDLLFYKNEAERQAVEIIGLKARIASLETQLAQERATTRNLISEAIESAALAAGPSSGLRAGSSREARARGARAAEVLQTPPLSTTGSSQSRRAVMSADSDKEESTDELDLLVPSWIGREREVAASKRSQSMKRKASPESRELLVSSALAARPTFKRPRTVLVGVVVPPITPEMRMRRYAAPSPLPSPPPHPRTPHSSAKGKQKQVQAGAEPEDVEVEESDEWEISSLSSLSSLSTLASTVAAPPDVDLAEGPSARPRRESAPAIRSAMSELAGPHSEGPRVQSPSLPVPKPTSPSPRPVQVTGLMGQPSGSSFTDASRRPQNETRGPSRELSYVNWAHPGPAMRPVPQVPQPVVQEPSLRDVRSAEDAALQPPRGSPLKADIHANATSILTPPSSTPPHAAQEVSKPLSRPAVAQPQPQIALESTSKNTATLAANAASAHPPAEVPPSGAADILGNPATPARIQSASPPPQAGPSRPAQASDKEDPEDAPQARADVAGADAQPGSALEDEKRPHDRLQGAPRYEVDVDRGLRSLTFPRSFIADTFGGSSQAFCTYSKMDQRSFIFPTLAMDPQLPTECGMPGLLCRATRMPEWRTGTQRLFVGFKPAHFRYMGEYALTLSTPLSVQEYRALAPKVKATWAKAIGTKGKHKDVRVRLVLRRELGRQPTALEVKTALADKNEYQNLTSEEIIQAYEAGSETMYIWRMHCVGFDIPFLRRAAQSLPLWVRSREDRRIARQVE